MTIKKTFKVRSEHIIALVGVAIALAWLPIRMRFPFDDTYITFRYAQNLAHGFGIVWNPGGAHTEGYTNFLYMLLLAPFSALGCDLVVVSQCINVISVIVSAIVIWKIVSYESGLSQEREDMRRLSLFERESAAVLGVALFYLDPFVWMNAFGGMETSVFTMFLLLAVGSLNHDFMRLGRWRREDSGIWGSDEIDSKTPLRIPNSQHVIPANAGIQDQGMDSRVRGNDNPKSFEVPLNESVRQGYSESVRSLFRLSFFFAMLAALTRPEGAMMGGIVFVVVAYRLWSSGGWAGELKLAATQFVLVFMLPLAIYAVWKYWYFGNLLPNSFYVKVAQTGTLLPGRGSLKIFYTGMWYLIPGVFALSQWKKSAGIQTMVVWCVGLTTFYLFSQLIQPQYDRFTNSIEVFLLMLAAIAIAKYRPRSRMIVVRYSSFVFILVFHVAWSLHARGATGWMTRTTDYEDRYARIASVFRSIPDHEHITLAWSDAGMLPYYSGMRSLDPVGLNTNDIAHAKSGEEVARIIAHARPDIIFISHDPRTHAIVTWGHGLIAHAYPLLLQQPELRSYRSIATVPQVVYDLDMLVDTESRHYGDIVRGIAGQVGKDADFREPVQHIQ